MLSRSRIHQIGAHNFLEVFQEQGFVVRQVAARLLDDEQYPLHGYRSRARSFSLRAPGAAGE